MNEWIDDLAGLGAAGRAAVLVTVAAIRGSAPRGPGAKMLVTREQTMGTIGGGQLEYECTRIAVELLGSEAPPAMRRFPLGAAMGQCCGGVVEVLFEPVGALRHRWLEELRGVRERRETATLVTGIGASAGKFVVTPEPLAGDRPATLPPEVMRRATELPATSSRAERVGEYLLEAIAGPRFDIAVFGAGHVGSAVVAVLARLDCTVRWVDSRRNVFPGVPQNVNAIETAEPLLEVAAMPAGGYYLVMTHSHALDFDLCDRILRRRDAAYCGLIGSRSKRRRFEKRFRKLGLPAELVGTLVCPIGVDGIRGKKPAEIAVATAAELLQARDRAAGESRGQAGRAADNVRPISA